MVEIIPAIMPQDIDDLEHQISLVASYVKMVQLDIMDGKFVRPKTWPYIKDRGTFEALATESEGLPQWQKVDFEIDLMVSHPENIIEEWIAIGATRLIIHVESTTILSEIVEKYHERGIELVLALNIDTPIDSVLPYLEDVHAIQFMGIAHIGYQGEAFDERVINKIRDFHNAHPEVIISVDGGVNLDTAPLLKEMGVHRLVSGSTIFNSGNVVQAIRNLES